MKNLILGAFTALSLAAAIAPAAYAFTAGSPHPSYHQNAYDNTQNSLGGRYVGGGDGSGD